MSFPEVQAVNWMLSHKDYSLVKRNGLTVDHFPTYPDEFMFLANHYAKYQQLPDEATFFAEYPDFERIQVDEAAGYLVGKLREQRLYTLVVPALKKAVEMTAGDSTEVVKYLEAEVKAMLREMMAKGAGRDVTAEAVNRVAEYLRRSRVSGLLGIPSGIRMLDDITHGWLPGDVVVISGYLGEGKSWLGLYFLMQAWRAGYKVCLVSLEMDELAVGFRFDTLLSGCIAIDTGWTGPKFSPVQNSGITAGRLGDDGYTNYDGFANWLAGQGGFLLYTAADFPNGFTVDDADNIFEEHPEIDLLCIDQLSLMAFKGKPKTVREGYIGNMRETKRVALRRKKIIMMLAQSGRAAAKAKDSTPELTDLAESNAVGEDADRVITLKKNGEVIRLALKKNRHGRGGTDAEEWMLRWGVDTGDIHPMTGAGKF